MAARKIRPIRVEGNIAYVPLTRGYEAIIDAADARIADGFNWNALVSLRADGTVRSVYAQRKEGPAKSRQVIFLHRAILGVGADENGDHKDGDGLNNRRCNLRVATGGQNQRNRRMGHNNTSGAKGVSWHKPRRKWLARIKVDGKQKYLGGFNCRTAAAVAYARASAALHKEFGRVA